MSEAAAKSGYGFEIRLALLVLGPLAVIVAAMSYFSHKPPTAATVQSPPNVAPVQGAPLIGAVEPVAANDPPAAAATGGVPVRAGADPRQLTQADLNPNIPLNVDIPPPSDSGDGFRPVSFEFLASYSFPRFPNAPEGGEYGAVDGAGGDAAVADADAAAPDEQPSADDAAQPAPPAKPEDKIPVRVQALNGQKVAVNGFMVPIEVRKGKVYNFMLVRNQLACCFGAPLELNEWIDVTPAGEKGVPFIKDVPITVRGTLDIGEQSIDGWIMSIYRLESVDVRPTAGF